MAVSPSEIFPAEDFNIDKVKQLEKSIDGLLLDPTRRNKTVAQTDKGNCFLISLYSVCSDSEKLWLRNSYLGAGWKDVDVFTDLDSGTSAHLNTYIRLYI